MKPAFSTDRLEVFAVECEQVYGSVTVYLGFSTEAVACFDSWPVVDCSISGGIVRMIRSYEPRRGLALELLLGLHAHLGRTVDSPLDGESTYTEAGRGLFKKYLAAVQAKTTAQNRS